MEIRKWDWSLQMHKSRSWKIYIALCLEWEKDKEILTTSHKWWVERKESTCRQYPYSPTPHTAVSFAKFCGLKIKTIAAQKSYLCSIFAAGIKCGCQKTLGPRCGQSKPPLYSMTALGRQLFGARESADLNFRAVLCHHPAVPLPKQMHGAGGELLL